MAIILTCVSVVGFACEYFGSREESDEAFSLQTVYSPDRSICFRVEARFKMLTTRKLDSATYEARDISLRVIRHDLGYQQGHLALKLEFKSGQTRMLTTLSPVYDRKYIPDDKFFLPTGRVFICGDAYYFATCDSNGFRLLKYDAAERNFLPSEIRSEKVRAALRLLFRESFCPDDVYWNYALVRHHEFFGIAKNIAERQRLFDTKDLYRQWKSLLSTNPH